MRSAVGWAAVSVSTAVLGFWAVWGSIEAFHEGWYFRSFWMNLGLTAVQYLSPVIVLLFAAVTGVLWPRAGAVLHLALAAGVGLIVATPAGRTLIAIPMAILAAMYWFGRIGSRRLALWIVCGVPATAAIVCAAGPAYRVSQRVDDGNREARVVAGRGVRLRWAPAGPGWPQTGGDWHMARHACAHLTSDGTSLSESPVGAWRLPAADEVVRSLTLHGENAGGVWDASRASASYRLTPDKESPLWDKYSMVIYWWTATEADPQRAYRITYSGSVHVTRKTAGPTYYGFRCVSTDGVE